MKTNSIFQTIDQTIAGTSTRKAEKAAKKATNQWKRGIVLIKKLADGGATVRRGGNEKFRAYGPGRTLKVLFAAVKLGLSAECIRDGAPELATRYPWVNAANDIVKAALNEKVLWKTVFEVLGLDEADIDVPALQADAAPESVVKEAAPPAKAAKKTPRKSGKGRKAAPKTERVAA